MEELIKLDTYPIRGLVGRLLQDKTTRKNILFASDSYAGYGAGYRDDSQMTEGVLLGFDSCDIQPRVYKAAAEQTERTRKRAEVFTPAWIVNQMNNHCDAEWFGRADVFNHQNGQEWTVSTEPVTFPEGKDWKQYVDSRRLEITCGEAPYIVSRYDTSTGEIIPIERRIGILDRKLRIVNENADDEAEWFKWAFRAFQSVYGYEYQGDNLLIARINLLYTLADYIEAKWHRQATRKELEKFLNVICWNFWQMDGLNDTPPYGIPSDEVVQMSLFDDEEETADDEIVYCKTYDWRADISKLFKGLKKRGKGMKFDFVIGNPPYQEEDGGAQASAKPVYHLFVESAKQITNKCFSIIMPARWYSGGKGLDDFRDSMLTDTHLKVIHDYPLTGDVFPKVNIRGGVCIIVWDAEYDNTHELTSVYSHSGNNQILNKRALKIAGVDFFLRDYQATTIIQKISPSLSNNGLMAYISSRKPFGLSTDFPRDSRFHSTSDGITKPILCYSKGKKTGYVEYTDIPLHKEWIDKWKVLTPYANNIGTELNDDNLNAFVAEPNSICTETYLAIGANLELSEVMAENLVKYLKTKFLRCLHCFAKNSQHATAKTYVFVPLQDFTSTSDIDWSKPIADIDQQLYKKYGLTPDEIKFIETHVKEME